MQEKRGKTAEIAVNCGKLWKFRKNCGQLPTTMSLGAENPSRTFRKPNPSTLRHKCTGLVRKQFGKEGIHITTARQPFTWQQVGPLSGRSKEPQGAGSSSATGKKVLAGWMGGGEAHQAVRTPSCAYTPKPPRGIGFPATPAEMSYPRKKNESKIWINLFSKCFRRFPKPSCA